MKHGTEDDKDKLHEATKWNRPRTQRTRETEDGRLVQRRIAQQIIRVRGTDVGATTTATVGVDTVVATATVVA